MTTTAPPDSLGAYIRDKRKAAGLNQDDLAKLCDVGQTAVSAWETNRRTPPATMLNRIAAHLPAADPAEMLALLNDPSGTR